jgi:hypothetical protein
VEGHVKMTASSKAMTACAATNSIGFKPRLAAFNAITSHSEGQPGTSAGPGLEV